MSLPRDPTRSATATSGLSLTRRHLMLMSGAAASLPFLTGVGSAFAQTPAAPFLPLFHRRRIGALDLTTINDGYLDFARDLIINLDPQTVEAAMTRAYLDPALPIRAAISVHVIRDGDQITLIDAGAGTAFGPNSGNLGQSLTAMGIAPDTVTRIVATHMHPDHIGGLMAEGAAVFPNAGLHVHETELGFWTDEAMAASAPADFQPFFALARAVRDAYGDRVQTFSDDADLGGGLTTIDMPGHTPGHSGVRVSDGDDQLIVWGDSTSIAALQFSHPDAGIVFDADPAQAALTRRRVLDMVATDRIAVAGTHLPFPGIGHVETREDAFAWVPEDWFATQP